MPKETTLTVQQDGGLLAQDEVLSPVMNLAVAKNRLAEFQAFVKDYLVEGEDYGTIPGTPKPTLLKPGADKLCELYGLADTYEILDKVEDYTAHPPLFDYTVRCTLTRTRTGIVVATGLGSCNSYESRYRYRKGARRCPDCGAEAIIKGKQEYGGGWLCFTKKGGCGAKFTDDDPDITDQSTDRVENEDLSDQKNTILKMAKKRAKIDATLSATRSSGIFTQDVEDMEGFQREQNAPQTSNVGRSASRQQSKPPEDVICAQCGKTNSHAADCPTLAKRQGSKPAAQGNKHLTVIVAKVESKKKSAKSYMVLHCGDAEGRELDIFIWHETPQKHAAGWEGKECEFEVSETKSKNGDKVFLSLDKVIRAGNVRYQDNEPVAEGDSNSVPEWAE